VCLTHRKFWFDDCFAAERSLASSTAATVERSLAGSAAATESVLRLRLLSESTLVTKGPSIISNVTSAARGLSMAFSTFDKARP
ncbi:MAG: hypothetical protein ACN6Q5_08890, partial [Pseudomonas sp.]